MIRSPSRVYVILLLTGLSIFLLSSCHRSNTNTPEGVEVSSANPTPQPTPQSGFERDLEYIRGGQFKYVWVFSRKDGKPLNKDDADYLRKTAPQVVDFASTDGLKAVAGTNFDLELGNLPLLRKRFVVEDYTGK